MILTYHDVTLTLIPRMTTWSTPTTTTVVQTTVMTWVARRRSSYPHLLLLRQEARADSSITSTSLPLPHRINPASNSDERATVMIFEQQLAMRSAGLACQFFMLASCGATTEFVGDTCF